MTHKAYRREARVPSCIEQMGTVGTNVPVVPVSSRGVGTPSDRLTPQLSRTSALRVPGVPVVPVSNRAVSGRSIADHETKSKAGSFYELRI